MTDQLELTLAEVEQLYREATEADAMETAWAEQALNEDEPIDLDKLDPYNPRAMSRLARALLASQTALYKIVPHCPNCGTYEVLHRYDERYSCADCLDLSDNNSSLWFSFEPDFGSARAALLPSGKGEGDATDV